MGVHQVQHETPDWRNQMQTIIFNTLFFAALIAIAAVLNVSYLAG